LWFGPPIGMQKNYEVECKSWKKLGDNNLQVIIIIEVDIEDSRNPYH
jgi:hypothetical protein